MPDWKGSIVDQCPLCSSSRLSSAGKRKDGAEVSKCDDCGVGFLNPMPNEHEIARMYTDYYNREDGIGYTKYPVRLAAAGLDYLLWNIVKPHVKSGSTLLDVGCAYGARVDFFRRRGLKSSGVDMSGEAVTYGRQNWNLDLRATKYEELDESGVFDIITMIDFVEHLPAPNDWARKTKTLTHWGSLVLILTPDLDCYGDYGEKWIGYNTSFEHVLFYNRQALGNVLRKHGFEIAMTTNVKSAPPVATASQVESSTADSIREAAGSLSSFPITTTLMQLRIDLMAKLTWQRLAMNNPRQNSLLVVARRTSG